MTTRNKTITDISTKSEFRNEDNIKKFHIAGFFSFGVNYSVNNRFQLFGQPVFRYYLTDLVDAPINEHLFNYGVEVGIRRKIK